MPLIQKIRLLDQEVLKTKKTWIGPVWGNFLEKIGFCHFLALMLNVLQRIRKKIEQLLRKTGNIQTCSEIGSIGPISARLLDKVFPPKISYHVLSLSVIHDLLTLCKKPGTTWTIIINKSLLRKTAFWQQNWEMDAYLYTPAPCNQFRVLHAVPS